MTFIKAVSLVGLLVGSMAAVGCSSEVAEKQDDASKVTLAGRIGGGSIGTRSFVGVSNNGGTLHVAARELHKKGGSDRTINVDVAAGDGSFKLDVARGSRWVITVDDEQGGSSIVKFGDGESAVSVAANGNGTGTVDVGNVHITGGEASTDVVIDGRFGLESTKVELDEFFKAANGALTEAKAALEEAQKAADEARKAADAARDAAEDARKAAEEAAKAAGGGK